MSIPKNSLFHACHMATTNSMKQHKLKKLIAWLSNREGRGKEFVSIYLPASTSIDEVVAFIKSKSDEILPKSDAAHGRLKEVLKNTIQNLKQLKEIPQNGLAIFAGAILTGESGGETMEFREIVPPEPITRYVCEIDNHFELEPLRDMLRNQKVVGIIVLDSKEASFGILIGEQLEQIQNITSGIPGKSGKGGQSQRRYERERDMELAYFFHRIAEHASQKFLNTNKITVLIVGGPGPTKHDFLKGDYLHYELKNAILNIVDTQSAGIEGVKEVLSKSSEELKSMCAPEEEDAVQRFLAELGKQDGLAIYGLDLILDALKKGEVDLALANDNTEFVENAATCKNCGMLKTMIVDKRNFEALRKMNSTPCVRCGATEYEVEEKDIVDVLEDAASQTGAMVEVISVESQQRAKLAALGGFGAIRRYRPT